MNIKILPTLLLGATLLPLFAPPVLALNGGVSRVTTANGWKTFEVISQGDNPAGGTNHAMPALYDGTGAFLVDPTTLRILINHENTDASVSEVDLNIPNLKLAISNMIANSNTGGVTFVTAADQAYDRWTANGGSTWTNTTSISNTSFYRFCSAQSFEPNTYGPGRGFVDHVFITAEEGSTNRLFALDTVNRDFYQLSGVVGNASATLGGIGGLPYDVWENAALLDTGNTTHIALVLSPDGGTQTMQLYIGLKGKDANGNNSTSFLARNGLAYGSYFYFNDVLPTTTPSTDGFFDATTAGALVSTKMEDVDTSPTDGTQFVLGDQDSGVFKFDTNLVFNGNALNTGASSFTITRIDDTAGNNNAHDNLDWTAWTTLGGTSFPLGLVFTNEDNATGEIYQMNPDGTNQIKVGQTTTSAESTGIFDLSLHLGYMPGSILLTTNQGTPASSNILIHPSAAMDTDGDRDPDATDTDDDNDSMPDTWEVANGLNPLVNDASSDFDGDNFTNAQEYTLGNSAANPMDPPVAAPGVSYFVGIDDRKYGTGEDSPSTSSASIWMGDGSYLMAGDTDNFKDAVSSSDYDFCLAGPVGVWCLWWAMDTDVVDNSSMQTLMIGATPVTPVHDETGYLRYESSPGVWTSAITDGFRLSSDHHSHTCVASSTKGVYCWAANSLTDLVASTVPASLKNVATVKDVAVGSQHACAINGNSVQCWGDSASGKTTVPGAVSAPKRIASGLNHTCAINGDGSVSCWGDNSVGQKGDVDANGYVDGISNAIAIAAGDNHTCVVKGMLIPGGTTVTCWGDNSSGQTLVPASLIDFSTTPLDVRAAGSKTCAVRAGSSNVEVATTCWPVVLSP